MKRTKSVLLVAAEYIVSAIFTDAFLVPFPTLITFEYSRIKNFKKKQQLHDLSCSVALCVDST